MIRYDVQVITPCTFDEEDNEYIANTMGVLTNSLIYETVLTSMDAVTVAFFRAETDEVIDHETIADTWFKELKTIPFFGDSTAIITVITRDLVDVFSNNGLNFTV